MANKVIARSNSKRWTAAQEQGIRTVGQSLLVSAAAGSGKTTVLAERCAYLVCDAKPPCDVDELLVVTFTEAAASEMRGRISKALRDRQQERPDDPRLARQLMLVEQANVSTLHAFCAKLLRQHFHLAGLDAGFRVMDADEAFLLRREVARDLFERWYNDESGKFHCLIDGYGQGKDEDVLRQVLHVYELLASLVDPAGWMERSRQRILQAIESPLEESEMGRELFQIIDCGLKSIRKRCDQSQKTIESFGLQSYADYLAEIGAVLGYWQKVFDEAGIDGLAEVVKDPQWRKLPTVRNGVANKEVAKQLIDDIRFGIEKGSWRDMLRFTSKEWQEGLGRMRPFGELFIQLVEEFGRDYINAKRAARSVDFSDLERLALDALRDNRSLGYHRRFEHVLVDEYQDINELQDAILSLVSRECLATGRRKIATPSNLFCVGDVKQSIYRFRLAEPGRFLDRQKQFRAKGSHGRVIDLQSNFRSRVPLLHAINCVFRHLMTADAVDIEYDQSHELVGALDYPATDAGHTFTGSPIDLHLLAADRPHGSDAQESASENKDDEEYDRTEREAILVAMEILRYLGRDETRPGPPMLVMEAAKDGSLQPRPAVERDVVILLRSMKHKAGQFVRVLSQFGIRAYADNRTGFFESMEVRDMLALLALLDNRRQDIPLASFLRSPLARLTDVETSLAKIRVAYPYPTPFHEATTRYAAESKDALASELNELLTRIAEWRHAAQRRPLTDLIWDIYQQTGYLAYVSGLEGGDQRVENLLHLRERAAQFGEFQSRGLSRFLRFLDQLREESDIGQPSTASEADNVVRILSIHKSKGLEFPIVFVPDLGKSINMQDCRGPIVADRKAGLGMIVVDDAKRCRYPSLASTLVKNRLNQQSLAEELRVLYVAMTRAREHLVLVGTDRADVGAQWNTRWAGHRGALPTDAILSARCMLDWIGPVTQISGNEHVFNLTTHSAEEIAAWRTKSPTRPHMTTTQSSMARMEQLPDATQPSPAALAAINRLKYVYPMRAYANLPAAQSVTSRTHSKEREPAHLPSGSPARERVLRNPRFVEAVEPDAAERGTATHLLLEHFQFSRRCDETEIHRQIKSLVDRRILTEVQADCIDKLAVEWFLNTEIGTAMREDPSAIRRELPVNFPVKPLESHGAPESNDPLDRIMVRGRLDVLIRGEGNTATLLDYKTDFIPETAVADRAEIYRPQLFDYKVAIEQMTGLRITGAWLAFLSTRKMHKLTWENANHDE